MIGRHYSRDNYNCAHFLVDWYRENSNIEIPIMTGFELSFTKWLIRNFTEILKPENGCLTVMVNSDYTNHVGVYNDRHVTHNYQSREGSHGSVVTTPLAVIRRRYQQVRFYKWSE